jgi:hypothetical protein
MKPYKLFLDDVRELSRVHPDADPNDWVVCRDYNRAVAVIQHHGWPTFISFDHDLGEDTLTGYDLARWLVDRDLDQGDMPDDFAFAVHSANPVGAANIRGLLAGYLAQREGKTSVTRGSKGHQYPRWLQSLAMISLALWVVGLVVVLFNPTPLFGFVFPLGLIGIWLTNILANRF